MTKLLKTIIITACGLFILSILLFISQMISGHGSLQEGRESIIRTIQMDTARLAVFRKTEDYKRLFLTKSKDSLEIFLNKFINTPVK